MQRCSRRSSKEQTGWDQFKALTALSPLRFQKRLRLQEARYGFTSRVDVAIYPHEEGISKPDPRIFALAAERLALPPSDVIFLDDVQDNVDAARACGFQSILFTSTSQAIAEIEALLRG